METKTINFIKRIITRYYPEGRVLKGNEFERGRQSLAIEIADVIDPINEDNTKPSTFVDVGDVLLKEVIPAKAKNVLGAIKNPTLCLQSENCSLVLYNTPFEKDMEGDFYEITVKKVECPQNEEQQPRARRRAKLDKKEDVAGADWMEFEQMYNNARFQFVKNMI